MHLHIYLSFVLPGWIAPKVNGGTSTMWQGSLKHLELCTPSGYTIGWSIMQCAPEKELAWKLMCVCPVVSLSGSKYHRTERNQVSISQLLPLRQTQPLSSLTHKINQGWDTAGRLLMGGKLHTTHVSEPSQILQERPTANMIWSLSLSQLCRI